MPTDPPAQPDADPPPHPRSIEEDRWCFGPTFFLHQLARFVREHCPDADESLPQVEIHLADGRSLDLCHIVGLTPNWVAVAVFAGHHRPHAPMQTELVPYGLISRLTISDNDGTHATVGFDAGRRPRMLTEEGVDGDGATGVGGHPQRP